MFDISYWKCPSGQNIQIVSGYFQDTFWTLFGQYPKLEKIWGRKQEEDLTCLNMYWHDQTGENKIIHQVVNFSKTADKLKKQ